MKAKDLSTIFFIMKQKYKLYSESLLNLYGIHVNLLHQYIQPMNFLPIEIDNYSEAHTSPESSVLKELNRKTYAQVLNPRMLSGHLQGRLLAMFSKMIKPKRILEIGTYTGYATQCLAEGLSIDGAIDTLEKNIELKHIIDGYFAKADLTNKINLYIGNALQIIPNLNFEYDIVFIDADKENYSNYFDLIIEKVSPGGFIIADNVLWNGKVVEPVDGKDTDTKAIIDFNQKIQSDKRVFNLLLPVRDGLMVMQKL